MGWFDGGLRKTFHRLFNRRKGAPSPSDITDAIKNGVVVNIRYNGNNHQGMREIRPYAYGVSSGGNNVIRSFQPSGDSLRGTPKWKYFRVDRIIEWEPTDQTFDVPDGLYNPNGDKSMSMVIYQRKFNDETRKENDERNEEPNIEDAEQQQENPQQGQEQQPGKKGNWVKRLGKWIGNLFNGDKENNSEMFNDNKENNG